jgi:hypothetical protein
MRLLPVLLLAAGLATSCGGGGPSPVVVTPEASSVALFQQSGAPVVINDPRDASGFPLDTGFVVTFAIGHPVISSDERGVGIVNDSQLAPTGSDPIKAINYSWKPSARLRPWAEGKQVCTSFAASVPVSTMQGSLGNYTGADIWLVDGSTGKPTSGKGIIVSASFYHSIDVQEGGPFDYVSALNSVQIGAVMGGDMWVTTTGSLRRQPWSEPAQFGFCINREQVQRMAEASAALLGGVMQVSDIVLDGALISNETNLGPHGTSLLVSYVSGWTISISQ